MLLPIHVYFEGRLAGTVTMVLRDGKVVYSEAGLLSTARDYARFLQMLLNGGAGSSLEFQKIATGDHGSCSWYCGRSYIHPDSGMFPKGG